jgi:hypothetical protein
VPAKTPPARRAAVDRFKAKYPERVAASQKKSRAAWKLRDPAGYARYRKEMDLKRKGLTVEQFDAIIATQGGRCAICSDLFTDSGKGVPHIDHDHECCPVNRACEKCLRGLLCHHCNMGLGRFRDNPVLLRGAAFYLLNPPPHVARRDSSV